MNVDLDELGLVVGVEMLQLAAQIPFSALVTEFHVRSDVIETLRLLRPKHPSLHSAPDCWGRVNPRSRF